MWVADSRVWSQSRRTLTQKEEQVNYSKPLEYDLPQWVVNRKKDPKDGSYTQQVANGWDTKIREDLEKMKKIKLHKGLRHYFGLKVRGQHTNSTGRRGKTVGVSRTKA